MVAAHQSYRQLITEGIQDLPLELLAEVADFVFFLRKRAIDPETFAAEQYSLLFNRDLQTLDATEAAHLEAELAGYENQYPHE